MINEKLYERLSSNERLNLILAALARDDHEETARLRRSCPEITYTVKELEFSSKLIDITKIFGVFSLICISHFNNILLARAELTAIIMTSDFFDLSEFKSMTEDEQVTNIRLMQTFSDILDHKNKEIISNLSYVKSAYVALENFCEEVDINYMHLTKWLKLTPIDELPVGIDRSSIVLAVSNPKDVMKIQELLSSNWSKSC